MTNTQSDKTDIVTLSAADKFFVQKALNGVTYYTTPAQIATYVGSIGGGTGTVTSVSVVSANGFAGTVATATTTPAITLSTTVNGLLKGNATAISAATSGTDYSAGTSALTTGILKSTTTTGALTIAVAGDFPTLNQNTTGTAASVTDAAQPNITSVGTLTNLDVDNININLNTISSTTGALNITPTTGSAIVLDGTINIDAGVITGATSITSTSFVGALTGNADTVTTNANLSGDVTSVGNTTTIAAGAIDIAMHSATGTPSATTYYRGDNTWATVAGGSSAFSDITTGTNTTATMTVGTGATITTSGSGTIVATTVSGAAQTAITSLGTLAALDVDNININGNTISATTGAVNITPVAGSAIVLDGTINVDAGVVTGATSISSTAFVGALTGNASTATTLATPRAIYGNNFDGSAALTQVIASTYGGTGNGFTKFSGATTSEKTYTLPDASATIKYAGTETIWIPAGAIRPSVTGGCAPVIHIVTSANQPDIQYLAFDATTQEYAQFAIAFPKSWDEGTVTAVFYWSHAATATNFGVVWNLQGVAQSDDDAIAVAYGTAQQIADTGGTTDDLYVTSATPAITIAGTPAVGDLVNFRLSRVTGDASDTMAIDARLMGIKLLFTTNAGNDD